MDIAGRTTALTVIEGNADENDRVERRYCKELLDMHRRFSEPPARAFQPGILVRWKTSMKNRTKPMYDEPMVVVEVLGQALIDTKFDSGSIYFRERLDLVLGFVDSEGEFSMLHYDPRRFESYPE